MSRRIRKAPGQPGWPGKQFPRLWRLAQMRLYVAAPGDRGVRCLSTENLPGGTVDLKVPCRQQSMEGVSVAFYSMQSDDFWGRYPKELEPLVSMGLSGASYFLLGQQQDNPPTVIALRMEPNFVSVRHAHDCYRFEVVVQGTLDVGDRVLKPGDVMFTEPGVPYGPHTAGPEGCTTFEFFTNYRSSHVTLLDATSGLEECDLTTATGLQKMVTLMRRSTEPSGA